MLLSAYSSCDVVMVRGEILLVSVLPGVNAEEGSELADDRVLVLQRVNNTHPSLQNSKRALTA